MRGAKSWRNATHDPDKPVLEALGYSSSLKPHQAEAATPAPILLMLLLILRRVLQLLALLDSIGRPRPPRCHVALGSLLGTQPKPAPAVEHPKPRGPGPRNYYSTILLYDYITLLLLFYYITIPPPFRIFLGAGIRSATSASACCKQERLRAIFCCSAPGDNYDAKLHAELSAASGRSE